MRFRKLRIAWSVGWGLAALLLIVLCVRSYSWSNMLVSPRPNVIVFISNGQVYDSPHLTWTSLNQQQESRFWYWGWYKNQNIRNSDVKVQIYGYRTRLPIWPFAICACAAMTLPWLPWLPWRFSLRTLLIATTLITLALGLIVWASK